MNRTQVILRNIASNWMGFAVQAGVTFFLTPFVLHHLGDTRYGIWAFITSITGYYGLLALGLQGGVNLHLTRYLARRDFQQMNMVASTAVLALTCVGLLVTAVSVTVAWLAPRSSIFLRHDHRRLSGVLSSLEFPLRSIEFVSIFRYVHVDPAV